jgi:hypothetical protein
MGTDFYACRIIVISFPSGVIQPKGDYNSNTGRNGLGTETVKYVWK